MPELKHTFTGGKMDKDNDERIVARGQYREALNIGVATSEGSDVGAAQNILGNIKVTEAIQGRFGGCNTHIAEVIDPQTDMLYRFVNTECPSEGVWMDRIVEYNTTKNIDDDWKVKEAPIMIDIYKVETKLKTIIPFCTEVFNESGGSVGGDRYLIKLVDETNLHQLRWGMFLGPTGLGEVDGGGIYIEDIDYSSGWIRLVDEGPSNSGLLWWINTGPDVNNYTITFHGDRNLNFHPDRKITGINIIDGMIFWTDNYSEPKKVNIERGKIGSTGGGAVSIDSFERHTRLVVDGNFVTDCIKDEVNCYHRFPVPGCTDPYALNFDSTATEDDGSCCYIQGCTNASACNYDATACVNDGSCVFQPDPCYDCDANLISPPPPACAWDWVCVDNGPNFVISPFMPDTVPPYGSRGHCAWKYANGGDIHAGANDSGNCVDALNAWTINQPNLGFEDWFYYRGSCSGVSVAPCYKGVQAGWGPSDWAQAAVDDTCMAGIETMFFTCGTSCPPWWNNNGANSVFGRDPQNNVSYQKPTDWVGMIAYLQTFMPNGGGFTNINSGMSWSQVAVAMNQPNNGTGYTWYIDPDCRRCSCFGGGNGMAPCDCYQTPYGTLPSYNDCNNSCCGVEPPAESWNCNPINGTCYDPGTGNGLYSNLGACLNDTNSPCFSITQPLAPPGGSDGSNGEDPSIDNGESPLYMTEKSFKNFVLNSSSPLKLHTSPTTTTTPPRDPSSGDPNGIYEHCEVDEICRPVFVLEKHMTVIRKGPTMPPKIQMWKWADDANLPESPGGIWEEGTSTSPNVVLEASFLGSCMPQSCTHSTNSPIPFDCVNALPLMGTAFDGGDISCFYNIDYTQKQAGETIVLPIDITATPLSNGEDLGQDWSLGDKIIIEHEYNDSMGILRKAVCRGEIQQLAMTPNTGWGASGLEGVQDYTVVTSPLSVCNLSNMMEIFITSIAGNFPINAITDSDIYNCRIVQVEPMFEKKFPKFAYRYQYEDGEYSVFGPWSELAFIPRSFDYLPKKGYNLGMENAVRTLKVMNWRPKNMPKDVIKIDILYKESNSPNIYTVESFKEDDPLIGGVLLNPWYTSGSGDHFGKYTIKSELIHKVVSSNQLLRPWDNVPRAALGQEITANRLIYANYKQNYNLNILSNSIETPFKPDFLIGINEIDFNILQLTSGEPAKSLKSMRTYQLGVVYRDRYGRETPVLTSVSGSIELPKSNAQLQNRLSVKVQGNPPKWAESYTFYIKETSNEYYNLAMDRWYDAEDGGIWLSFPSSERNKITNETVLILKKQHNSNIPSTEDIKYKVISVKNDAPKFIKTDNQYWGSIPMMLPPPGWGNGDKVGNWDSGMFSPTGLPLPNHLELDVYAEYWDQSVLNELSNMNAAQVRIVQTAGQAAAYNAATSTVNNKTNWYDVASVSYIGTPAQTEIISVTNNDGSITETEVEIPGQVEQLVRVQLEKVLGSDADFCIPKGLDQNLSLSRGLSLEARTKVTKDRAQFEGRFFVKILRDSNIDVNIVQPTQKIADTYQVLQTKDLKYICAAHPGLQDWSTFKISNTTGVVTSIKNFIPIGMSMDRNGVAVARVSASCGSSAASQPYSVTEYSSLSRVASAKGAYYNDCAGGPVYESIDPLNVGSTGPAWPFGPGQDTDGFIPNNFTAYHKGIYEPGSWWHNRWKDYLYSNPAWGFPDIQAPNPPGTNSQGNFNNWPSVQPPQWTPYSCEDCSIDGPSKDIGIPFGVWILGPDMINPLQNGGANGNWNGVVDISMANNGPTSTGPYATSEFVSSNTLGTTCVPKLDGANPYQLPAIWGDQSDFMSPTPNYIDQSTGVVDANLSTSPIRWTKQTILKLREDWYYLWNGKDVDDSWPLGRFHPERWIIDKVGSVDKYSGNGIWDDGVNGYMQVSYWGIGSVNAESRDHNMTVHQESEVGFADALSTVGTKFRFKQDPDQIIYTIVNAEAETVYNYEAPHGSWGVDPGPNSGAPGFCYGGGGIGSGQCPPWGTTTEDGDIAGATAFISDLFSKNRKMVGGAPYNYRIRFTLTLDKPIGRDGINEFHPITNHVDATGKANIKTNGSIGKYSTDLVHVTPSKGGTPPGVEFFNLASYWNANDNAGDSEINQPQFLDDSTHEDAPSGQTWYADNPDAHIGLHERGLNETTIELVTQYKGEDSDVPMSTNPAIWETEPMEDVGLDIYYAASPTYPVRLERHRSDEWRPDPTDYHIDGSQTLAHWYDYSFRGEEFIPVGAKVEIISGDNEHTSTVCNVQDNVIWITDPLLFDDSVFPWVEIPFTAPYPLLRFSWDGEGTWYGAGSDKEFVELQVIKGLDPYKFTVERNVHNVKRSLGYFNCYTYGTGVESNRVRDDYNAVTIDKGIKASMPLAEQYEEERKSSSLIFSGIYNSTSGINRTNQFIQAEPITKDLNPINGSIQKLHTRDTDLVTFCENKVFKILAKKDALFNADGNTNVTSNQAVLGQTIPFSGEYGISKNPESFASESYRIYFADKARGTILRLSKDGLTPISDYGMKDWFKDNLRFATSIIGSFDDREDQYNITLETADQDGNEKAYTLSYTEARKGWVSFKSFIHQGGISHKNIYYTFPSNKYNQDTDSDPWGISYAGNLTGQAETWQHHLDLILTRLITATINGGSTINITSGTGVIISGMNVEGNGIPMDTTVISYNSTTGDVTLNNSVYIEANEEVTFTTARNSFYGNDAHYSMVKVMFNGDQGNVKRFRTINYEGTQTKVDQKISNSNQLHDASGTINTGQIYYDNFPKLGWYVEYMETDLQEGLLSHFINKEGKWFDYIKGFENSGIGDNLDTGEFSLQGLGHATLGQPSLPSWNCNGASCDDPGDGSGVYFDFNDCQTNCPPPPPVLTYDCIQNVCVPNMGGSGVYPNLVACQTNCTPITTVKYMCEEGSCIVCAGTGFDDCGSNLTWGNDSTCGGNCVPVDVDGCTDPLANNYNPLAIVDDGSCTYNVSYNCNPQTHLCEDPGNGSGIYATINACWADPNACTEPIVDVPGCTDPYASNYDPNATIDDGSCEYEPAGGVSYNCINHVCVDPGDGSGMFQEGINANNSFNNPDGTYGPLNDCIFAFPSLGCGGVNFTHVWECQMLSLPNTIGLTPVCVNTGPEVGMADGNGDLYGSIMCDQNCGWQQQGMPPCLGCGDGSYDQSCTSCPSPSNVNNAVHGQITTYSILPHTTGAKKIKIEWAKNGVAPKIYGPGSGSCFGEWDLGQVNIQHPPNTYSNVWTNGVQNAQGNSTNGMQQPACSGNTCWFVFDFLPIGTTVSGIVAGWSCSPGTGLGGGTPHHWGNTLGMITIT